MYIYNPPVYLNSKYNVNNNIIILPVHIIKYTSLTYDVIRTCYDNHNNIFYFYVNVDKYYNYNIKYTKMI